MTTAFILKPTQPHFNRRGGGLGRGLVGAWLLTEGQGLSTREQSDANIVMTGTLGGTTGTAGWAVGPDGYSLQFTAANTHYVTFPAASQTTYAFSNTTFSVLVRAKYSTNAASGFMIACDSNSSGTSGGWAMFFFNTAAINFSTKSPIGATCASVSTTPTYADGFYHDIVAVCRTDTVTAGNNTVDLYVDGGFQGNNVSASAAYGAPTQPMRLGSRTDGGGAAITPLNGNISSVMIWNRGLLPDQIAQLAFDPYYAFRRRAILKATPPPPATQMFRRTSSRIGTRIGTRQTWSA
jgi:concanavalin A-like lectin/glucanase superfamily protein